MGEMGVAESYEYSFRFKNLNDQDLLYIISFELGHNLSKLLDSGWMTQDCNYKTAKDLC